jgi:hypothetical protein
MSDRELVTIDAKQFETIQQTVEDGLALIAKAIRASGGDSDIGNRLDQLFLQISNLSNQQQLILELIEGTDGPISNLNRKVDTFMATQEERLQAILVAVQNVKQMLADLKVNNPAIEDEITAIEKELAPATEPVPGGGETPPTI